MILLCMQYLDVVITPLRYHNTECTAAICRVNPHAEDPNGIMTSGLYFLPFSIAASISFVWKTFPILPRYLRLYSRSNEDDCLAFSISSAVYILPRPYV